MAATTRKAYRGRGMDGIIARMYDRNARAHIMHQYRSWAGDLVPLIPPDGKVLEIAPGPGYLAIELAKAGIKDITGLDISETFVEIARSNAREAGIRIDFLQGNASVQPFVDGSYTHIICTSAFKNFSDPLGALREMHRVLSPGGLAWISDMRQDVSDAAIDAYVRNDMHLHGMNGLFTRMTFKRMLRPRALTAEGLRALVAQTPFTVVNLEQEVMELRVTVRK
jgi:ubiquinone/menaquinone biosynthesis C-methylase UbiE